MSRLAEGYRLLGNKSACASVMDLAGEKIRSCSGSDD